MFLRSTATFRIFLTLNNEVLDLNQTRTTGFFLLPPRWSKTQVTHDQEVFLCPPYFLGHILRLFFWVISFVRYETSFRLQKLAKSDSWTKRFLHAGGGGWLVKKYKQNTPKKYSLEVYFSPPGKSVVLGYFSPPENLYKSSPQDYQRLHNYIEAMLINNYGKTLGLLICIHQNPLPLFLFKI